MNIPGRKYFQSEKVYSDWFPRGGDDAFFRAEKIDTSGTALDLVIEFYTKNSEDTGDGKPVVDSGGTNLNLTVLGDSTDPDIVEKLIRSVDSTSGSPDFNPEGFYELVRLKVTTLQGAAGDWMLARIFPPIFFDRADDT